jgi:hypothetical protein
VAVRVLLAGASEPFGRERGEAEVSGVELRVLSGEDERRRKPAL